MHRRLFLLGAGVATTLLLTSCGDQTITVSESAQGITVSIVVTSDSTAIAALQSKIPTNTSGAKISNGDNHTGNHVCGFNVSKNGHTYQVDLYGTIPSTFCDKSTQDSFLQDAP